MLKRSTFLLGIMLWLSILSTYAQQTTIWLVRHAEKAAVDPTDVDPELSAAGSKRAIALNDVLKNKKISTIYTTNYKRTKATVTPLAAALGLTIKVYNPRETQTIAADILKENAGKEALIVGHSNTIVPFIKALGCDAPFETLTDYDYDMLFEVVINGNEIPRLLIRNYGEKHHTTTIPAAFARPSN